MKVHTNTLETLEQKLMVMNDTAELNAWKHVFWGNDEEIATLFSLILQKYNIEYRNINDQVNSLQTTKQVNMLLNMGEIGGAVDLLKYDIINQHGGIVTDLNYELIANPDIYFHNHDMILTRTSNCGTNIENYMIAVKKSSCFK